MIFDHDGATELIQSKVRLKCQPMFVLNVEIVQKKQGVFFSLTLWSVKRLARFDSVNDAGGVRCEVFWFESSAICWDPKRLDTRYPVARS